MPLRVTLSTCVTRQKSREVSGATRCFTVDEVHASGKREKSVKSLSGTGRLDASSVLVSWLCVDVWSPRPGKRVDSGPGESAMDASVRKALTSLKALLDEGFITKAEFGTRRQVIIDQATAVQQVAAPQTSADSTGITGPARSVFDRLGEPHLTQKRGVFDRLGLPKPAGSIRKPGVHGEQTDLRAKLTGGIKKPGAIKKPGERDIRKPGYDTTKPRGPAACPW